MLKHLATARSFGLGFGVPKSGLCPTPPGMQYIAIATGCGFVVLGVDIENRRPRLECWAAARQKVIR